MRLKKGRAYKSLYLPAVIIVATVFTLLIVIAVSTYRNIGRDRQRAEDSLLREGFIVIRAIEASIRAESGASPEIFRIQKIVEEVSREPSIIAILLFDGQGNLAASSPNVAGQGNIPEVSSLALLMKEKGVITRYARGPGGERNFEVIRPLRPLSYRNPLGLMREEGETVDPREEPLQEWARDKFISVRLRPGPFEAAREQDLHHAFLMGGILVILGAGALYFIFIVQNYYAVDRSLSQMRTYTENVVESMADALISIDREKKIVTLNRRAGEILGAAEGEFKGKRITDVLGGSAEELLQGATGEGNIRNREIEVRHPSGKAIPLSLSAAPLKDEMGREMGSVLLLRDLREIRDLQEKVRRSERLASLGRLAAGVAHEIRNPLSSIRGFAQFFIQRFKGQQKEQEYASIMVKEVDRLNRVITELLDFARPKDPHRDLHSLGEIVEHTLKLLEPELTKRNVAIEKVFPTDIPSIPVDRDQVSQALLNLLLNSMESMDGGGKIRIDLRESSSPPSMELVLSDTGKGIPPEDLGKVFDPFFSTKRKGTGLGLAIVHQIVESHKGEITVESREGGTTFRILLPMS